MFLEDACEMLRIVEAKLFSGFGNGGTTDEQSLGTLHYETMDVGDG